MRTYIAQRLILEHAFEILNVSRIEWTFSPWMRSTLQYDKVMKWAKAKVHDKRDLALLPGKMHEHSEANAKCKDQLQRLPTVQRMRRFRVTYFPGTHAIETYQHLGLVSRSSHYEMKRPPERIHVLWGAAHDNSSNCQT